MQKAYSRINWENYPSDKTPLNESNLNRLDAATDEIDNRVISLNSTKLDLTQANQMVQDVTFNETTGVFTVTKLNGSTFTIDTKLERISVNWTFNSQTQQLIITLDDGTTQSVDLSALITQYEFLDSDTIAFSINDTGKVTAIVKEGGIQEKHLQPNYLADVKVEVAKATQFSQQAKTFSELSESSAKEAESYAHGNTNTREGEDTDNAKYYSQQSKASSQTAQSILDDVIRRGNDAVDAINNAADINSPNFIIDLATGHIMYESARFNFTVNNNGHLGWELLV